MLSKNYRNQIGSSFWLSTMLVLGVSCKKLVEIGPPTSSISTSQAFADSADANSAVLGIYSNMMIGNTNVGCGYTTIFCGMSADELLPFYSQGNQFVTNTLNAGNTDISNGWSYAYKLIYQTNACIEALQASTGMSQSFKNQLIGEAKVLRSLYYFYLINLFGDVPYVTGTDYRVNALASTTPKSQIYDSLIFDLNAAKTLLPSDYSFTNDARVRANSFAASALLSRIYLYLNRWALAESEASIIIDNVSTFSLDSVGGVFLKNSHEAILQWNVNSANSPYNANIEGLNFIPYNRSQAPRYYLTNSLLKAFENGDLRRTNWVDSSTYNGTLYYYPYKYKVGPAQQSPGSNPSEYYTVFRVAEQYLIRAEARVELGDISKSSEDLNSIRVRAKLPPISNMNNAEDLLDSIAGERRVELFAEWGNRWFDLKRKNKANEVLSAAKSKWQSYQQLYPIPVSEIRTDPNLSQNTGYTY